MSYNHRLLLQYVMYARVTPDIISVPFFSVDFRQHGRASCHNRTLMAADLRLCGTHFLATSELSLFVLALPTAKRRMLKPLAPVQKEGFRK